MITLVCAGQRAHRYQKYIDQHHALFTPCHSYQALAWLSHELGHCRLCAAQSHTHIDEFFAFSLPSGSWQLPPRAPVQPLRKRGAQAPVRPGQNVLCGHVQACPVRLPAWLYSRLVTVVRASAPRERALIPRVRARVIHSSSQNDSSWDEQLQCAMVHSVNNQWVDSVHM